MLSGFAVTAKPKINTTNIAVDMYRAILDSILLRVFCMKMHQRGKCRLTQLRLSSLLLVDIAWIELWRPHQIITKPIGCANTRKIYIILAFTDSKREMHESGRILLGLGSQHSTKIALKLDRRLGLCFCCLSRALRTTLLTNKLQIFYITTVAGRCGWAL